MSYSADRQHATWALCRLQTQIMDFEEKTGLKPAGIVMGAGFRAMLGAGNLCHVKPDGGFSMAATLFGIPVYETRGDILSIIPWDTADPNYTFLGAEIKKGGTL